MIAVVTRVFSLDWIKLALPCLFLLMKFSESVLNPAIKPHGFQANEWKELSPTGSIPSARYGHTCVWSDVANGFFVFGGYDGTSFCLSVATLGNCPGSISTVTLGN